MRINFACGNRVTDGWFNVDAVAGPRALRPPELIYEMRFDAEGALIEQMDVPDNSANELQAIHFLEHLYAWQAPAALAEWHRVLAPGGKLVLEMPDFLKFCRNIAEGIKSKKHPDQLGMWGAYGDPRDKNPFMCHRWGYWFDSLKPLVAQAGFIKIKEFDTVFHRPGRGVRDFRLEAIKPQ